MRDHHHVMAFLYQLSGQLINVYLHTAELRVEEVADHAYAHCVNPINE